MTTTTFFINHLSSRWQAGEFEDKECQSRESMQFMLLWAAVSASRWQPDSKKNDQDAACTWGSHFLLL
jgi:hypothetical protein